MILFQRPCPSIKNFTIEIRRKLELEFGLVSESLIPKNFTHISSFQKSNLNVFLN